MIKRYYPFWLGLIACIIMTGLVSQGKISYSFAIIIIYIIGYFKLTKFNDLW